MSWAIHYVDDFFTIRRPTLDECQHNMAPMHKISQQAGLLLELSKTKDPSEKLTFLGIELDTTAVEIRLPEDKLVQALKSLAQGWRLKETGTPVTLWSPLSHTSKVVRSRIFLWKLIDLSTTVNEPDHFICLNTKAKSDIEYWFQFIRQWNVMPCCHLHTYTSIWCFRKLGCGAFRGCHWFYLPWNNAFQDTHISAKDLARSHLLQPYGARLGKVTQYRYCQTIQPQCLKNQHTYYTVLHFSQYTTNVKLYLATYWLKQCIGRSFFKEQFRNYFVRSTHRHYPGLYSSWNSCSSSFLSLSNQTGPHSVRQNCGQLPWIWFSFFHDKNIWSRPLFDICEQLTHGSHLLQNHSFPDL